MARRDRSRGGRRLIRGAALVVVALALAACGAGSQLPRVTAHLWVVGDSIRPLTVDVAARRCTTGAALRDDAEPPTSVGDSAVYLGAGNVIWFGPIGHLHIVGRAPAETAAITIDRGHVVYAAGTRIVTVGGDTLTLELPARITALAGHDGRYAVDAGGDLYVVTNGVARRAGAARDVLAWSPDGKRLAPRLSGGWTPVEWLDNRDLLVTRRNEIGVLAATGGTVERVCATPSGTNPVR